MCLYIYIYIHMCPSPRTRLNIIIVIRTTRNSFIIIIVIISSIISATIIIIIIIIITSIVNINDSCVIVVSPVSMTRFPSFRTQTLESLSRYLRNKWVPEQPRPWRKSCERESCYGDWVHVMALLKVERERNAWYVTCV